MKAATDGCPNIDEVGVNRVPYGAFHTRCGALRRWRSTTSVTVPAAHRIGIGACGRCGCSSSRQRRHAHGVSVQPRRPPFSRRPRRLHRLPRAVRRGDWHRDSRAACTSSAADVRSYVPLTICVMLITARYSMTTQPLMFAFVAIAVVTAQTRGSGRGAAALSRANSDREDDDGERQEMAQLPI